MAQQQTGGGDEEPTRVIPPSYDRELPPEASPAPPMQEEPDLPPIESIDDAPAAPVTSVPPTTSVPPATSLPPVPAAADPTPSASVPPVTTPAPPAAPALSGPAAADPNATAVPPVAPPPDPDSVRSRGRAAADRTAEGAKVAADRVSAAASATAQALRDTDVHEIARSTTSLIETARPFFLAAFAIVFSFLASVENHAAIGVVFAVGAILCVLGAAYSAAVDKVLKRGPGNH